MKNIQYFVNEEKGIVVAKLSKEDVTAALTEVYEKLGRTTKYNGVIVDMDVFDSLCGAITAKATCSPDDAFVEEVGMAIAKKKVLAKLALKKEDLCWKIAHIYNNETGRIIEHAKRYTAQTSAARREIDEYITRIFE